MKGLYTDAPKSLKGYTYLRVAACIAIISLHTANAAEILYRDGLSLFQRSASLTLVYCLMWAVPCFVMVSGALLLDPEKEITLQKIFNKYFFRIMGALIVFGLIYRAFDIGMNGEVWGFLPVLSGIWKVFKGESWAHLWYLYLLLGLYLLLPFYRMVAKESTREQMRYLLLIYAIFLSFLPPTRLAGVTSGFYIHVYGIYPFYFFAGYAISKGYLQMPKMTSVILLIVSTAVIIILSRLRFYNGAEWLDGLLTSYSSPLVILQALSMFSLFGRLNKPAENTEKPASKNIFTFLDDNGLGIYLIHMIFIRLTLRYMKINPYKTGFPGFLALVVINLIISCIIAWALKKIKGLRRVL